MSGLDMRLWSVSHVNRKDTVESKVNSVNTITATPVYFNILDFFSGSISVKKFILLMLFSHFVVILLTAVEVLAVLCRIDSGTRVCRT